MDWKSYYEHFYDWADSTRLRHLSSLKDFGPSAEVCELACEFFEEADASRMIKKALAAGVHFTAEEVLELDGVVEETLMVPLIESVRHPLSAEQLDDFTFWLSEAQRRKLAKKNGLRVDESGYVLLPEEEEALREQEELDRELARQEEALCLQEEEAAREERTKFLALWTLIRISKKNRRERRKRREGK